jgi:hypothetical protein
MAGKAWYLVVLGDNSSPYQLVFYKENSMLSKVELIEKLNYG